MHRRSALASSILLLLLLGSCRRDRDDADAAVARDAGVDAAADDAGGGADAGPGVDAGALDAGTSAEDAVAILEALDYAATVAALSAGPLVADAAMVDAGGDAASDASIRDRVENGVARDSIVADAGCTAFAWTARTATITFTGCTSETTGLAIEGTVTLAVTFRPTTFAITFDALAIDGVTIDGSLELVVMRDDTMTTFLVSADVAWTDGGTANTVALDGLAVTTDSRTGTTTLDGGFDVAVGGTSAAGTLEAVTWQMGDCHPSSGTARFTLAGGAAVVATFLPTTPATGAVLVQIPPFPAVEMTVLAPCE